ncbi:MrcB family domain-containing protein [Paenibacillus oceani]|nr:DUF3578 domain-containing protein [Paenibacillus oceani]
MTTLPSSLTGIFAHKQKSYKMVLTLAILDIMEEQKKQEVPVNLVRVRFLKLLQSRESQGQPVDAPPESVGQRWSQVQGFQINGLLQTPIKALKAILVHDSGKQTLRFTDELQAIWSESLVQQLREYANRELESYYQNQQPITTSLREHLAKVMSDYVAAKREPFTSHPLGTLVRNTIPQEIHRLPFIDQNLRIQGSVGMGNWATVPWVAIMDRRITETTQRGEYIVYLFAHDMSAVYLAFHQGVTVPTKELGKTEGYKYLRQKAEQIQSLVPLEEMHKDQNIQLTASGLGQDYQVSTVAYYRYDKDSLPSEEQLLADLRNVMENYKKYVEFSTMQQDEVERGNFPFTIAHLYLGQGILYYLYQNHPSEVPVQTLSSNPSSVLISGEQVKHPLERVRHIGRALQELKLLTIENNVFSLTDLGLQYGHCFQNDSTIWRINDLQVQLLRSIIEKDQKSTSLIGVLRQTIGLVQELQTFTLEQFIAPFMQLLGMGDSWGEVTQRNRAIFMLNWLGELRYVDKNGDSFSYINYEEQPQVEPLSVPEQLQAIQAFIKRKGFMYPDHLIENLYLSLKTKPFVILAGVSGTGKTKLVKLFAEALGATSSNQQFTLIPVRPDWSDPSDLLGYKDLSNQFRPGKLTEVLAEATRLANRNKPYFICLDEMNLARVEHYFSDLLSVLETQEWQGERIVTAPLIHRQSLTSEEDQRAYGDLHVPDNVYLIGTVNMDETTHPFSKKVLDRANTIEFNYINLGQYPGDEEEDSAPAITPVPNSFLRSEYLQLVDMYRDNRELVEGTTEKLVKINGILEDIHAHVGFRIRDAVCFYMLYNERFQLLEPDAAFDQQLLQKILPRVQGSSTAVKKVLLQLMKEALGRRIAVQELLDDASELYTPRSAIDGAKYPQSARKIAFMLRRLDEDGFTSYWLS